MPVYIARLSVLSDFCLFLYNHRSLVSTTRFAHIIINFSLYTTGFLGVVSAKVDYQLSHVIGLAVYRSRHLIGDRLFVASSIVHT